jgi:hypothetical protein
MFLARPERLPDGIPVAVKDLFDTAGLTTTYGSVLFADHVPRETAESVRRLEAAGYAVVGKTNLHEFAYGVTSQNEHFGTVPNPVAPGRLAGGSSGGSGAALAAGIVDAALGSDSGGSIRIPAAWCGVVGFKPTYGLVPSEGCFPLAPGYDHVGPMGRTVEDCTAMMCALAPGLEPRRLESLEELEVGVAWLDGCEPLVRARVEARRPRSSRARGQSSSRFRNRPRAPSSAARWRTCTAICSRSMRTRTARASVARSSAASRRATASTSAASIRFGSTASAAPRRSTSSTCS